MHSTSIKVPVRISGWVDKKFYSGVFSNLEQLLGMKVRLVLSKSCCNISLPPRPILAQKHLKSPGFYLSPRESHGKTGLGGRDMLQHDSDKTSRTFISENC